MKDARESLIRKSGLKSPWNTQVHLALVQPTSHQRWQCKVTFYYLFMVMLSL